MATKKSGAAKLSTGYKVTLWVIGIILFLAFAFATFCACGGLKYINPQEDLMTLNVDEDGRYYYYNSDGEKVYLDIASSTDVVSSADNIVSAVDAAIAE